jgi:hypothetical protein
VPNKAPIKQANNNGGEKKVMKPFIRRSIPILPKLIDFPLVLKNSMSTL